MARLFRVNMRFRGVTSDTLLPDVFIAKLHKESPMSIVENCDVSLEDQQDNGFLSGLIVGHPTSETAFQVYKNPRRFSVRWGEVASVVEMNVSRKELVTAALEQVPASEPVLQ